MWSNDNTRQHPRFYEYWAGKVYGDSKPTFGQNLKFFNRYQLGWMYWRYFMWNFAGRQNDIQGHYFNGDGTRDYLNGNWISGINFIDEARLGPQDNLPDAWAHYIAYTRLGGSKTFTELLECAGLDIPFDGECLRRVCEKANQWLEDCDLSGIT